MSVLLPFLAAAGAVLLLLTGGFALLRALIPGRQPFSLFGLVPLCFGVGLAALAAAGNLAMLAGLRLPWAYGGLAVLCALAWARARPRGGAPAERLFETGAAGGPPALDATERLLLAAILFGALSALLLAVLYPLHYHDSRAIWGAKAKMLFHAGTLFSPEFMDPHRVHPHFRYPLLLPMAESFVFTCARKADDRAVMLLIGLFFPMLVSFLYDLARILLADRKAALTAAALIAVLPAFFLSDGSAFSGYADTPLAALYALALGTTLLWRREGGMRWLALSAFLTGALPLVKNEGGLLAALTLVLIAFPGRGWRNAAARLPLVGAVVLPWLLLVRRLPLDPTDTTDVFQLALLQPGVGLDGGRIAAFCLGALLGTEADPFGNRLLWGLFWPVFLFSAALCARRRDAQGLRLAATVLAYLALIAAGYAVLRDHSAEFWRSNFFRLCLPIAPVAALQIAGTLSAPEEPGSDAESA
ncbi:MAG: glycosyltransferase family 39 protein [Elusimicrobiota bacterium]|jgi:hypothetical protein